MRFIDLFAGTGGIRIGFEQALKEMGLDGECVFTSEIDKKAQETYALNFGEMPAGDIHETRTSIPDFDFLLAGFPCQPFSYAGKRKGFGDTRGTLFFEIEKILEEHQPRGFLLENVRGLFTHDKGRTLQTIIHSLEELGYAVHCLLCNSSNFGVPQNRVRVYILGVLGHDLHTGITSDLGASDSHKYKVHIEQESLFNKVKEPCSVRDILDDVVDDKYHCTDKFVGMLKAAVGEDFDILHGKRLIDYRGGNSIHSWDLGIKGRCTIPERNFMNLLIANRRKKVFGTHQDGKMLSKEQISTFYKRNDIDDVITSLLSKGYLKCIDGRYNPVCGNMSFEVFKFLDPDSISITLTSSDAHKLGVYHNGAVRRITPREAARLQGFPEDFILHPEDTATYKQMGNAVSVPVIRAVIKDMLTKNPSLSENSMMHGEEQENKIYATA